MRKKYLSIAMAALLVSLFPTETLASIDTSVFEEKDIYNVEIDDFDDTGEISFNDTDAAPSDVVLGTTEDDEGIIIGNYDIKIVDSLDLGVFRISLVYSGEDWIFTDEVIIKTSRNRYTFSVSRETEVDGGKIYEGVTLVMTDESKGLLEDLIKDGGTAQIRLSGERKVDGKLIISAEGLKTMYDDYTEAGGFDQDLSVLSGAYRCEVKKLE